MTEEENEELSLYLEGVREAFSSLYDESFEKNSTTKTKALRIEVFLWINRLKALELLLRLGTPESIVKLGKLEDHKEIFDPVLEFWQKQL